MTLNTSFVKNGKKIYISTEYNVADKDLYAAAQEVAYAMKTFEGSIVIERNGYFVSIEGNLHAYVTYAA